MRSIATIERSKSQMFPLLKMRSATSVLCPSLPVPSGYTFNERGRLIGKRLGGNPTHENMRHDVFKIHATHSTLRAALDKIDEAGLKAALARTLE